MAALSSSLLRSVLSRQPHSAVTAQCRRIARAVGVIDLPASARPELHSSWNRSPCRYVCSSIAAQSPSSMHAAAAADAIFSNNPLEFSPSSRILDMEQLFSQSDLEELTEELALLQQAHGVQCVVATVPSAGAMPPKTLATHVFNTWGIGSPLFNNGLLILLSTKERWWYVTLNLPLWPEAQQTHCRSEIEVGGGRKGDIGLTQLLSTNWLQDLLQQVMVSLQAMRMNRDVKPLHLLLCSGAQFQARESRSGGSCCNQVYQPLPQQIPGA